MLWVSKTNKKSIDIRPKYYCRAHESVLEMHLTFTKEPKPFSETRKYRKFSNILFQVNQTNLLTLDLNIIVEHTKVF